MISTASASSGKPKLNAASTACRIVLSIISRAAGMMPAEMMALIVLVASSIESKTPSIVRTAWGSGVIRTQILVTTPNVPSAPTMTPVRS